MLLDTYGLVYRAFFALPPLSTTRGVPINAAYGFTMMLNKLIADEKPTHVIACFDKGIPQQRKELYPEYKAQRTEMPDDLRPQFELVRRILTTFRIPMLEVQGEEADDVIATLARQVTAAGHQTLIVTGDLDLLQVVNEHVTALVTRRGITELSRYTPEAVHERFGLETHQLVDYRGLKGDPSDNLPGIPGVGEKTAAKLLHNAGSLDALLENPKLAGTPKLQNLIVQYGEQARACRDVSRIRTDLDLQIDWEDCLWATPPNDELYKLYRDLEFKTLLNKLEPPPEPEAPAVEETVQGSWRQLTSSAELTEALLEMRGRRLALCLADDRVLGLSVDSGSGLGFDLALLDDFGASSAFGELWDGAPEVVAFDSKRVLKALHRLGLADRTIDDDPMIAAHLLNPTRAFTAIADAAGQFLQLNVPEEAGGAAAATLRLPAPLRGQLQEREQLKLYQDIELPLTSVLARMEEAGVLIDPRELEVIGTEVEATAARLQTEIHAIAGEEFNIGSPQQLGAILFEKLGLPGGKKTKTGWGTGVEVLQGLCRDYPVCSLILEYREVTKLKNTYVDVIPRLTDRDGRLRTQFNQTSTATGRLSSANPNLQNIPVRGELGRRIRKGFVAPAGCCLLAADYSQIELRLMAHLSGDEDMRRAFRERQDIHDFTARQIFSVGDEAVSDLQRRIAKSVNFGLLYGMSDFGLAQRLEISRSEAKEMTTAYFARFPSVKAYIKSVLEKGRDDGFVTTLLGRRRYMPGLRSSNYLLRSAAEREATNAPIQGSAADLMKLAMVRIDRVLRRQGLRSRMLLQIHDELMFEVPQTELATVAEIVRHEMEHALELTVPLEATVKSGPNWYDVEPMSFATSTPSRG